MAFTQSTTGDEDEDLMSEILVTATKRVASIQDIPISVTALGTEIIESRGAEDIRALTNLSASVNFIASQSTANTTSVRIRGVGTSGNNAGFESSVGIFIDGVYQPRPGIALGEFVDIDQVEILRGPQGTLFGRNTSVGAIHVKSNKPDIYEAEGFANISVGDYSLVNVQAGYNQPLADGFAVRISGAFTERDGMMNNADPALPDSNDRDRFLVRAQMLWEPSNEVSLRFIADVSESDERCCDPVLVSLNDNGSQPAGTSTAPGKAIDDRITDSTGRREQSDQFGVSAELKWALGDNYEFTYLPAYRESEASNSGDTDMTSVNLVFADQASPNLAEVESQTHEVHLQAKLLDGRLDSLVGLYYADEKVLELSRRVAGDYLATIPPYSVIPGYPDFEGSYANNLFVQNSEAYSIFTHNIYNVTDDLAVTLGLRYVDEQKKGGLVNSQGENDTCANAGGGDTSNPLDPYQAACLPLWAPADISNYYAIYPDTRFTDNAWTYTANVAYSFSNDLLGYVSTSEGFKSGGINLDITGTGDGNPKFRSEVVTSYEIGFKSKIFQNRVTANVALFHMDIDDFQILTLTGLSFDVFNVEKAKSTGIEIDIDSQLTSNLQLDTSLVYTNARFPSNCSTDMMVKLQQCGRDLPNAPEFVAVVGADYTVAMSEKFKMVLTPNVRYETSSQPAPANPAFKQGSSTVIDFRAALSRSDESLSVELWGKNLSDENTLTRTFDTLSELPNMSASGSQSSWVISPRSYGVTLRTRF